MSKLLDVALIVRNEAENLPDCLESLKQLEPILGRINIYDAGSFDDSVDIARDLGANVKKGHWDDDIARARNESIALCEARWVLVLEADERIHLEVEALRAELVDAPDDVATFSVKHRADGAERGATSPRVICRTRMHYVGAVHEQLESLGGEAWVNKQLPAQALRIERASVTQADRMRRLQRTLTQLDTAVEKQRGALDADELDRVLIDRARTRIASGDVEGGMADYEEASGLKVHSNYHLWGLQTYAAALISMKRLDRAETIVELLEQQEAPERVVVLLKAQLALSQQDATTALELVRQVDQATEGSQPGHEMAQIIQVRMQAATEAGQDDEALACCLRLMVSHRMAVGMGSTLVLLWGNRELEPLVDILREAPADFIPHIIQELNLAGGIGPAVARVLGDQAMAVAG